MIVRMSVHRLQQLREAIPFSIAELAEYANLSPDTIRRIEEGSEYKTSYRTAAILAEVFDCEIGDIFEKKELSHLGRPPQTGKPIKVTTTQEVKIEHTDGSVDTITVSHTRQGAICPTCYLAMPLSGICENCD